MKLMMYIGNDFIEAINLDINRISKPGYVGQFKRTLKIKYRNLIEERNNKPDFLVVPPDETQKKIRLN
ncbi:MAG: hypothetical protein IPN82_06370 [Chitinophagaceae bacterium]|nr:hypothetical protein [Chitinophagaceae bacterium]MBK8606457.1 hypothetical protein [Chitinophagaceae bacterium]MBP6476305.1 hypothetical protein [Chitinophagaceae bacterium]MBP7108102.1 hypothetical protein [Chitinophagaceae bacterium]MBP7313676.1 hypothetical protein [Chitinophagaceae bacterium]